MPSQATETGTAYYSENDRAPALRRQLVDGDGNPIDLSTATSVTIIIGRQRWSHYYSPYTRLVDRGVCNIEAGTDGWVNWVPGDGELSPPGNYEFVFEITWPGGLPETVPPNSYETLIIKTKPGGVET